jgi:hypothetical protein
MDEVTALGDPTVDQLTGMFTQLTQYLWQMTRLSASVAATRSRQAAE